MDENRLSVRTRFYSSLKEVQADQKKMGIVADKMPNT